MDKRERGSVRRGRWGAWLLVAALMSALWSGAALAAPAEGATVIADRAAPKPQVTIQGNVVVNKGKPTGFYELALCVQTARIVTRLDDPTNTPVPDSIYANALKAAEEGDEDALPKFYQEYKVTDYPFQAASTALTVNLDALSAVTWEAGTPIYNDWTAVGNSTSGTYADHDDVYPRGINKKAEGQPDIFTDLSPVENATGGKKVRVRLDTAKPDEVSTAAAFVEAVNKTDHTALVTLSASTTTTRNVVYATPTPVVVIRFAYDRERFQNLEVGDPRDLGNVPNESDFWAGLDVNDRSGANAARTALTYLGARDATNPADPYKASDAQAAGSSVFQSVWYAQNLTSDGTSQETTHFYYYLGGEFCNAIEQRSILVYDDATETDSEETLYVPKTAGNAVLVNRDASLPPTPGDQEIAAGATGNAHYSFFQNLLQVRTDTLRIELVNAPTYRKPTGGGGITILMLDWDGSPIGSLIVDGGDVRAELEEYIEENLVHPDLLPGTALKKLGGKLPEDWSAVAGNADAQLYQNLTNSLARDYTYRGKYAYTVGDPDDVGADGDTEKKARANGEDYPLTNKLDYVFTKRVNTSAAYTVTTGATSHTETYVLPHKLTDADMVDAALYPYTYGWAVVEDTSTKNKNNWKYMYDAAQEENVWTTIGVGELTNVDPDYYDGGAAAQTLPTTLGAATYQAPAFLVDEDPYWVDHVNETPQPNMTYTDKYAYSLNSNGSESYFRFADFSDIDAELERCHKKNGDPKDTLVVKAVYEPGKSLLDRGSYEMIQRPYYNKLNDSSAADGGAYSVQVTIERQNITQGQVQGVSRIREPVVRQDNTIDQKWIESDFPEVDHDLANATISEARSGKQSTYTKVDVDNGEAIQFTLSVSARQNKVNYVLVEQYSDNFVTGGQRSEQNYNRLGLEFAIDNYNYRTEDSVDGDGYFDCEYETRNGSYGFVLSGTLNRMMRYATLNHTEGTDISLVINYKNMQDANLRANLAGDEPAVRNEATMQRAILNAAIACEAHKGDPNFWNDELNCAELNYHQLQWYIIDGSLDTREVADGKELAFCHLHEECAAALSTVPDTWDKVITAARAGNTKDLTKMTTTAIESITSLRRNTNGRQFDTSVDFSTAIIDAVARLDAAGAEPTWGNVQYAILNRRAADPAVMRSEGEEKYWWFDGSTVAPTLPSVGTNKEAQWNFLIQAAKDSYTPVPTLKDGVTGDWLSSVRLNLAQTPFDRNSSMGQNIHKSWIDLTHNLVLDAKEERHTIELDGGGTEVEYVYTHEKFPSFEDFKTRLVAAIQAAETNGAEEPTWEQLQWYIIKGTWENDPDGYVFSPTEGWWWKDGNVPLRVSSLTTLLSILDMKANPVNPDDVDNAEKALRKVNAAFFDDTIYLRFDADGKNGQLKLADLPGGAKDAAWAIDQVDAARRAGATSWNQVQYYLLNGSLDEADAINRQAAFYWWKNGGEGVSVDFSTATSIQSKMTTLMAATIRTAFYDPKAIESVNNAVGTDTFPFLRLMATLNGQALADVKDLETDVKPNAHSDADSLLADVAAFKAAAQAAQGLNEYALPDVSWYQLQYYVFNKAYIKVDINDTNYTDLANPEKGYWWYDPSLTARPEPPPPPPERDPQPTDPLSALLKQALAGDIEVDDLLAEITTENMAIWQISGPEGPITDDDLEMLAEIVVNMAVEAGDNGAFDDDEAILSWPQIQLYIVSGMILYGDGEPGIFETTEDGAMQVLVYDLGWDASMFPPQFVTAYPDYFA